MGFPRKSCFSSKSSHGHEECSLDNAAEKLSTTAQKIHSRSEKDRKFDFLEELVFHQDVSMNT